jgi:flavin reductase (DIM6/NTAB) family NADH-FMN oxidoreductase RutF/DNA-binding IclR family transcriptional regulator
MTTTQIDPEIDPQIDPEIDPALYREVLGHYPTGVTVVTGLVDGEPVGMVVGTFTAVSLDPPLVAFMPTTGSGTYARLARATAYCINVLAHDQQDLCRTMATPADDKFADVAWHPSALGAPALDDAVAQVHCTPEQEVEAGDHYIVLCRVQALEVTRPVTPLLFFQGGYGGFSPAGMAARGDADLIAALRLTDTARHAVERLAHRLRCEAAVLVGVGPDELTTAFSAYGGSAEMVEPLGQRIPLIPPIGEAYVAGAAPEVVERWLSKVSPRDPELVDQYRARLASVERRGAGISLLRGDGPVEYEQLGEALRDYATGELTPARERELRGLLASTRCFFEDRELVADETYRVGGIVVPVRNPEGDISMVLRVTQLPAGATGAQVEEWIATVRQAAREVERHLAAAGRAALRDYRAWYDADFPM